MSLRTLIERVAAELLSSASPQHAVLRAQLHVSTLHAVEFTGVGLFARFQCPDSVTRVTQRRAIGGDVSIELPELAHGAGGLISVNDGVIDFVEIYTNAGEPWPREVGEASLTLLLPLPLDT
jgi:hypothetical protein